MSSRRLMPRSYTEGRSGSYNGDDVSGGSRASGSCSYLSSVRPENSPSSHRYSLYRPSRSTLCSVMAHLTEETQPLFETTLKSRSVSETSNVKFNCVVSGYPAPEVTWYKDDTQLDRYCGLPKYKVSRDGQNHSLHIYNCTVDDAAIYQASARNSKGIVSCSGVLEVGTMSEYKIHQQYFAKLKQKAENKRRALEESRPWDKENHGPGSQEQLRTISPERSQRKRRSPMEASLSSPSSMEDEEEAEENTPVPLHVAEARLQAETVDGEKPAPTTNGAMSSISNGQAVKENGSKGLTYTHDAMQNSFTAHPPKAPLAKKKIKISNGVESVKAESLPEMASEETVTSEGAGTIQGQADSLHAQGSVDEVMEMESSAPDCVKEAEQAKKASLLSEENVKVHVEGKLRAPSSTQPPLDLSASSAVPSFTKHISWIKSEYGVEPEKVLEIEPKNNVDYQGANCTISSQPSSSITSPQTSSSNRTVGIKAYLCNSATVMESDEKPPTPELTQKPSALESRKTTTALINKAKCEVKDSGTVGASSPGVSINGKTVSRGSESVATPCDRETVLPQRLVCEQSGDQLSGKETSGSRKNVSVSRPPSLSEVKQAHTLTKKNDAPVKRKPLTTRSDSAVRSPQRPPSEREVRTDAKQTPTLHNPRQLASDEMTQNTWDHSRGLSESRAVPSTDLLKSPLESQGDSKNKSGCSVSPTLQQGQVEIAIKTIGRTETPVDKNVQGNGICQRQLQIGTSASVGKKLNNDTEVAASRLTNSNIHQGEIRRMKAPEKKNTKEDNNNVMDIVDVKMENNVQVVPKALSPTLNLEAVPDKAQITDPCVPKANISAQQTKDIKDVSKPVASVMSIAEVLQTQTKALASSVNSSEATQILPTDHTQNADHPPPPSQLTEIQNAGQSPEIRMEETEYSKDSGEPKLMKEVDTNICSISAANVVLGLDEVESHSHTKPKILQSSDIVSPVVETLPNKFAIPPISIIDMDNAFKNRIPIIIVKDNESIMDTGQESGLLSGALLENIPDISLIGKSIIHMDYSLNTTSIPAVKISQECKQVHGNTTEEMDSSWTVPPKVNSDICQVGKNNIDMDSSIVTTSIPPVKISQEHKEVQGNTTEEMDSSWPVPPKVNCQHDMACVPQDDSKAMSSLPCDTDKHSFSMSKRPEFSINLTPTVPFVSDVKISHADTAMLLDSLEEHRPALPQHNSQSMDGIDTQPLLVTETQDTPTLIKQLASSTSREIKVEENSKTDPLTPALNTEESPLLRKKENIPSATPRELALGARRKIFPSKPKAEDTEATLPADGQSQQEEVLKKSNSSASPSLSHRTPLLQPPGSQSTPLPVEKRSPLLSTRKMAPEAMGQESTPPPVDKCSPLLSRRKVAPEAPERRYPLLSPPPAEGRSPLPSTRKMAPGAQEKRSPLLSRRMVTPEAPGQIQIDTTTKTEEKPAEKDKHKQFKAPQVIRKIRGEPFSDASGHLKLWCQFFNVLSDSTIKWYRDEVEISEVKKSAEDETQVALAIVQTSSRDCGVYGCTITNEYGTDSTDFLLSVDILAGMFLREDLAVGEEIEMTPLLFNKGLADSGAWGNKLFGRIMMMDNHLGEGCSHKACRARVIYGLEPLFESGTFGIIKVRSPISYGDKGESNLVERNLENTQLECRIQNIAREYCKIFAAETRVIENFGPTLEVIPLYLMYRPANTIPHATVEADLQGLYLRYCLLDAAGRLVMRTSSLVEQKCCALQHWIHQWTNGNILFTRLEGVDTKITNVGMSIKSKGYQGLTAIGNPMVFEQFISQHQCNYYCGLLKLRVLKTMDSLQTPVKIKGSRSPLLQRKAGPASPQTSRKVSTSPRVSRKAESEDSKATSKQNTGEALRSVR